MPLSILSKFSTITCLIFFILFESIVHAGNTIPYSIVENTNLIRSKLTDYKLLNNKLVNIYNDIKTTDNLCKQFSKSDLNENLSCKENPRECGLFLQKSIKDRMLYCMITYQSFLYKLDSLSTDIFSFKFDLKDIKYSNYPQLIIKFNENADDLAKKVSLAKLYTQGANQIFQKKHFDYLNQEFAEAIKNASTKGSIEGLCSSLKTTLSFLNLEFTLLGWSKDFGKWYKLSKKVSGFQSTVESLKNQCANKDLPQGISDLESKINTNLQSLDKQSWINSKCSKLKLQSQNQFNFLDLCESKDFNNPLIINILAGVE